MYIVLHIKSQVIYFTVTHCHVVLERCERCCGRRLPAQQPGPSLRGGVAMLSVACPLEAMRVIRDSDEGPTKRLAAVQFLAALESSELPPGALPSLLILLDNSDARIREAVFHILERLEPEAINSRIVVAVVRRIEDPNEVPLVKLAAARVMGLIDPEALDAVLAESEGPESASTSSIGPRRESIAAARAARISELVQGARASAAAAAAADAASRASATAVALGQRIRRATSFERSPSKGAALSTPPSKGPPPASPLAGGSTADGTPSRMSSARLSLARMRLVASKPSPAPSTPPPSAAAASVTPEGGSPALGSLRMRAMSFVTNAVVSSPRQATSVTPPPPPPAAPPPPPPPQVALAALDAGAAPAADLDKAARAELEYGAIWSSPSPEAKVNCGDDDAETMTAVALSPPRLS